MTSLKDTNALIVDARDLSGGTAPSVSYLVSYFIKSDKPVHLRDIVSRNPGTETFPTDEFWSLPTPFSYTGKVVVLTSHRTLSAGESFVYDLQAMKLATVVGETTAGAANAASVVPLGRGLALMLSGGRTQHAVTGTNWEGAGVKPEVATSSTDALRVALERLGEKPSAPPHRHAVAGSGVCAALHAAAARGVRCAAHVGRERAWRAELRSLVPRDGAGHAGSDRGTEEDVSDLGAIKSVKFVEVGR